jgi:hypothetical protein
MVGGRWGVAADHDPFLALYSAFDHFQTICVTNHLCQTRRVQPSVSDTKGAVVSVSTRMRRFVLLAGRGLDVR